jgi:preprotein translocase subunit Sec63
MVSTEVTLGPADERRAHDRSHSASAEDLAIDRERVLAKRAQVQDGDYFSILGVDEAASAYEVRRAFERHRVAYQPETFAEPLRAELADAFDEIQDVLGEAYRVLGDDAVRAAYRAGLRGGSGASGAGA